MSNFTKKYKIKMMLSIEAKLKMLDFEKRYNYTWNNRHTDYFFGKEGWKIQMHPSTNNIRILHNSFQYGPKIPLGKNSIKDIINIINNHNEH